MPHPQINTPTHKKKVSGKNYTPGNFLYVDYLQEGINHAVGELFPPPCGRAPEFPDRGPR